MMQDMEVKERFIATGRLIHILSHQMKRQHATMEIDDVCLTNIQRHVLKFILLETMHRDIYQKDIEEEFQIRKSTVTGILQLMEKNGFILRENAKQDARLKKIVPTRKAQSLRPDIIENIQMMEKRLTDGIGAENVEICREVLWQMICNLTKYENENKEEIKNHE